ncbi:hypothetical protein Leryth_021813 [Lithospermum erythrorhizon]|nr:hypothetical protein Leryth_021813 [Lithospermum erythrorhizon]
MLLFQDSFECYYLFIICLILVYYLESLLFLVIILNLFINFSCLL